MKKLLATSPLWFLFMLFFSACNQPKEQLEKHSKIYDKKTRADLALEHNYMMIRDPETLEVPRQELWLATEELKKSQRKKDKAAISNISWTERGPNNVGGRTRALLFDPNDINGTRVFAGSVAGGLWVCDDIYTTIPTWTAVDDFLDNLAITSIAYDPQYPDTMYMGTGEGFYNADAVRGDGIFYSTDGGVNWTQLSSSTSYTHIQKIVVDSAGNIYAATRGSGIIKSSNSGSTWSSVLNSSGSSSTNRAADIEIARNGDIYAAMGIFSTDGVYKSTDGGSNWTQVYSSSGESRIEIACAPNNSDVIYMVTQSSSTYNANAVRRSDNGGGSWTSVSNPNDAVGGTNFCRQQAWYDLSLTVDPNNDATAYMGGIDLYKTTNSGSSWTQVSHWYGGGGYPEVHADQHIALYAPGSSDSMLFGNDGGVYLTEDASNSSPTMSHIVNNYNVTQFYSGAIHPTSGTHYFLAGSQDNGSHRFNSVGVNATYEVTGGDGAFVHIDQANADYQFTSYVYNQYRRSTNGGTTFSNVNFSSSAGKFINPTDYDSDAEILYASWGNGTYMRWASARSASASVTVTFGTGSTGEPSAVTCDPNTSNRIYIGTDNGEIWRIDNADGTISQTDVTGGSMPSGYVSCIAVQDGDANHLIATFSNYSVNSVWESTDAGSSWTSIEGNLPNIPIRWALFSPIGGDSAFLATELGVWTTDNINGGSTSWAASNTGLANVRTDMLQYRSADSTIIAATHGRGLFSLSLSEIVDADFAADNTLVYPCETISFTDASLGATSWAWDFDNDGNTDATDQNPTWTYSTGGLKTVTLTVNGTETETKTSYIQVLPKLGTPYSTSDGGDFESNSWHFGSTSTTGTNLWERGNPSNFLNTLNSTSNGWKTDLDADCPDETITCHLYTPSFNMSTAGTYSMSFRKSMETFYSATPYAAFMEYSTNGGTSWTKLGVYNDPDGTNWYNKNTIDASVVSDQVGWHGTFSNQATSLDISDLAGNYDVRFRLTFTSNSIWSTAGFVDGFMIDDFSLSGPNNDANTWEIETALNSSATEYLGPNDTVHFISSNCKIIATVINLSAHDYGSTTVTIDAAGTSAKNFASNTAASKRIFDKTLRIIPTTNNSSGSVKITTYFDSTEAQGWKTSTSNYFKNLNLLKTPGAIASALKSQATLGSSPLIDSSYGGSDLKLTASFSNGFSGVAAGLNGPSGPVPVELIDFSGTRTETFSAVRWTTASEIESDYFVLQRMNNGKYEDIATLTAAGFSNQLLNYEFEDRDATAMQQPVLYYRLKQYDTDGSMEMSNVLELSLFNSDMAISVSPIPADQYIRLDYKTSSNISLDYAVTDLLGQKVLNNSAVPTNQQINVGQLDPGTYFLELRSGARIIKQQKILIMR